MRACVRCVRADEVPPCLPLFSLEAASNLEKKKLPSSLLLSLPPCEQFSIEIPDAEADKILTPEDVVAFIVSHPQAK